MENWRDVPGGNGKYQIDISTKEGKLKAAGTKRGPKFIWRYKEKEAV